MRFTIEELIKATGGKLIIANEDTTDFAISTDTRTIGEDMLYIPLKGENFNGFDFIQNALDKGASGYFTDNPNDVNLDADVIILVDNTKNAYLKIAEFYRNKVNPKVIMITGSSGKTTVKEMIASVTSVKFKTHKTKLNHNNEIGLCQTFLSMPSDTEVLIAEGGMRGFGEIELLSKHTRPDFAIITNVGTAHIGRLGSAENIAKAKCEIVKYLNKNGLLVAPNDFLIKQFNTFSGKSSYVDFSTINVLNADVNGSEFKYGNYLYRLNQEGEHNVQNACLVIETALALGMSPSEIANGLVGFKSIDKRWEMQTIGKFNIINDCYNSNPDSVKAAIKTFLSLYAGKKVLVLGDMGELGVDAVKYHKQTGNFLNQFEFDCLLTLGELSKNIETSLNKVVHFDDKKALSEYLYANFNDGAYVLLKASRSMKFEEIIEELNKLCH